MKLLLTGGSGHLGANLVRRLIADGHEVRALAQPGTDNRALDGLPLEIFYGDLRNLDEMRQAVAGMERIYHTAAKVSTVVGGEQELFECNVLGTRNLLRAAREAKVGRVVVTGSFSAVGHRTDGPSDESVPFNPFAWAMPYEKSKAGVEHECLKAVVEGQDVVVATSCAIIGPNDFLPSRMGRVIRDFANGKFRAYIPGGFEFVAARDIVAGHLLAMEKGRTGQKYIIASEFKTTDQWMEMLEEVTGQKRPPFRIPAKVMMPFAHVSEFMVTHFFPKRSLRFTPGAVHVLAMHRHADISKAKTELGFMPTAIKDAVREAYEWFVVDGQISNPLRPVRSEELTKRMHEAA
jgi:nucleoside-diphosphate-sugar epimerase